MLSTETSGGFVGTYLSMHVRTDIVAVNRR